MNKTFFRLLLTCALAFSVNILSSAQTDQKEKTTEEVAAEEAERLEGLLHLQGWQVFYVDSTLQHDYAAMKEEIAAMQKSRISNYNLYVKVQDKWMQQIDDTYKRIFDEKQWAAYLKSGAARAQKARDKRAQKAEKQDKVQK